MKSLFIVVILALMVACAPADSDVEDLMEEVPTPAEEQPETSAPADDIAEPDVDTGSELTEELESFLSGNPEYMVEYDFTAQGYSGTMTMYMLDGMMRVDSKTEGVESRTYMAEEITTCTNTDGWTCFQLGEPEESYAPTEQVDVDAMISSPGYSLEEATTRTIAGEEARCFVFVGEQDYTICYASSGAMLAMELESGAQTLSYEAKSYSEDVSNADFELPAEPQSMEDIMGSMGDFDPSQYQ